MSDFLKTQTFILAAPEVVVQEVDDACVFLNLRNEAYYGLDAVGYEFYQILLSGLSVKEALDKLQNSYEIDSLTLENDMIALLDALLIAGIITIKSDS